MASFLQVENISKSYGPKVLFENISFNINEGDKIALIAPNGTGKSSLLSILAGEESSDSGGSIKFMKDISIAFLKQNYDFNPENTIYHQLFWQQQGLYEAVEEYHSALAQSASGTSERLEKALAEMDRLDAWTFEQSAKRVLTQLKLTNLNQKMCQLSGGEVKKVAIASMLLSNPDFLIMDEPTNHLDMEVIEFLEDYLKKSKCTLFMVTHDRYFLDRVCNTIFELDNGSLYSYKGNYSYYLEKREERISNYNAATERARNLMRRELEWIRSTPCARSGKAKYRIDAFRDLKERAESRIEEKRNMDFSVGTARMGTKIIECRHLHYEWEGQTMLEDFSYNMARGEKIGIVGANGVGKSTFLNLVTGALKADSGTLEIGETVRFGYYRQQGIEFSQEETLLDVVNEIADSVALADGTRISTTSFLNRFLFPPNMHNTKVARLSGGERRRLYLLTVLMRNPNFLILDEPTNDLDIITLNVLEEYLQSFPGCVLIVSHDRYFLDKIADHLFIFTGGGRVKDYVGKCSEYRAYVAAMEQASARQEVKLQQSAKPAAQREQQAQKEQPAAQSSASAAPKRKRLSYKEQRELEEVTNAIAELESEKAELERGLSSGTLQGDELRRASERIGEVISLLDEKEMRWLELND
ncbi:MAG: ABC-F family ATP-binding cassette domain-containing protein [Candidatus Egerieousia sp.]|nr:ABC-F family ATP-binding cassette domain-containing protein [bacterium]MDY5255209.1 ABC-F family ATP-binding cassette domain-containing protein [Candidatus Egerieousia sp.]